MSEPARRLATAEDLARTLNDGRVYEILNGELEATPRPVPAHGWAQAGLCGEIVPPGPQPFALRDHLLRHRHRDFGVVRG